MIATIIAIIAAATASVFDLGYMGTVFRQRDNRTGYAACIVAAKSEGGLRLVNHNAVSAMFSESPR